jgi:hypothetical protein
MTGKRRPGMAVDGHTAYYSSPDDEHSPPRGQQQVNRCANCGITETKVDPQQLEPSLDGEEKGKKDSNEREKETTEIPKTVKLSICSSCYQVRYCSRECQKLHWKHHKPYCLSVRNGLTEEDGGPSPTLSFAERLQEQAVEIQVQHEELQEHLNEVICSLSETMTRHHIDLPLSWRKRDRQTTIFRSRASLEELFRRCLSGEENAQLAATKECRKLLSDHKPPIGTLVEMGLVPIFVDFLQNENNTKLQFETAWVLTNICSGTSQQTWAVVEAGLLCFVLCVVV